MPRIPVHTTEFVTQAASQLTEFTSSLQSAVPPRAPYARSVCPAHRARPDH